MGDIAIRVENLSKMYRIGRAQQRHDTLRDALVAAVRAPFRRPDRLRSASASSASSGLSDDTIWALKDVAFEVKRGEVLGIIGRNGAGKTTLLKILSRITEPTEGYGEIHGRVGSLLEVGTGFHPELTGRENVYLSGAILGMKRAEIARKFAEIVDFSGVEKFLDTPFKRYSSGMRVRLGFAVAAHLDPEVLLVDEVLAVGDAAFQAKCLGKMGGVAKEGRTVLFVSHNMAAVQALCSGSVLFNSGRLDFAGTPRETVEQYLTSKGALSGDLRDRGATVLRKLEFINNSCNATDTVQAGEEGTFRIHYQTEEPIEDVHFSLSINTVWGAKIASLTTAFSLGQPIPRLSGEGYVDCFLDSIALVPGQYSVSVALQTFDTHLRTIDHIVGAFDLFVAESDYLGTTRMASQDAGFVLIKHRWTLESPREFDC